MIQVVVLRLVKIINYLDISDGPIRVPPVYTFLIVASLELHKRSLDPHAFTGQRNFA